MILPGRHIIAVVSFECSVCDTTIPQKTYIERHRLGKHQFGQASKGAT